MSSDTATRILDTMSELTVSQGALPSMDAVAKAAGVSKGGLIHHFPSRTQLLQGLADHLSRECEADFQAKRAPGNAGRTWLETSTPESTELASMFVLITALQALRASGEAAGDLLEQYTRRTEQEIAAEVGSELDALVLRLVGDGLLLNALIGTPIDPESRAALVARLTASVAARA